MSMKQSYFRYRISFAKQGIARFIGHLDLQNLFQRAIKRAKLPVAYSEGFNPHQLLSFAAPLPLGMAGHMEILEVFLIHKVSDEKFFSALDEQLPEGINIVEIIEVPAVGRSAAAIIRKATYRITFSCMFNLDEIIQLILESEIIEIEKKSKKGTAFVDIRPDIFNLKVESEQSLRTILACGSEKNLKPEVLARYILSVAEIAHESCDIVYERLTIGQDVPPL